MYHKCFTIIDNNNLNFEKDVEEYVRNNKIDFFENNNIGIVIDDGNDKCIPLYIGYKINPKLVTENIYKFYNNILNNFNTIPI